MQDEKVVIKELRERGRAIRDARDWTRFHDPKNIAEAIVIEAGELLELFLWKTKEEVAERLKADPAYFQEVKDELADVLAYVLGMANALDVDLSECFLQKMDKVEQKYPIDKAKGNAKKYTEL